MIDTHAHLDFPEYNLDREEVISRFFEMGGKAIVNVGVDLERSRKSIEIAEAHDGIFASVGLHPDFFSKAENDLGSTNYDVRESIDELKTLAMNKNIVAIGETGLDYFSHTDEPITDAQKENQKQGFLAQIEIAQELNLPVIVHCREAWEDMYQIISLFYKNSASGLSRVRPFPFPTESHEIPRGQTLTKFVLHCYSGEKKDTEKFLGLPKIYFSFSGNITYPKPTEKSARLAEAVSMVSLDRIMLDSDSPLMAPQPKRGKRNEPAHVSDIVSRIAEIKGISEKEVEKATDKNAIEFFDLNKFKSS